MNSYEKFFEAGERIAEAISKPSGSVKNIGNEVQPKKEFAKPIKPKFPKKKIDKIEEEKPKKKNKIPGNTFPKGGNKGKE